MWFILNKIIRFSEKTKYSKTIDDFPHLVLFLLPTELSISDKLKSEMLPQIHNDKDVSNSEI